MNAPPVDSDALASAFASAAERARFVRERLPAEGLFADHDWRTSPVPYPLGPALAKEIESLGRVLLQFYRAVNLLYRRSVEGKQPAWIAELLDRGKPRELIELQRLPIFKNEVPRVIRPDILLTENSISITELDSVPGGIGLTGWLNQTYSKLGRDGMLPSQTSETSTDKLGTAARRPSQEIIGGADRMIRGFESIFGDAKTVHIVVSEEAATYKPEMAWLAEQLNQRGGATFNLQPSTFNQFANGDAVYRFFELFDLANVPNAWTVLAGNVTPPPKPQLEEKMWFAFLWMEQLRPFWREQLGEPTLKALQAVMPRTWLVDATPLPPHAVIPELGINDWREMARFSQKQRELVLKISGFHEQAWGARSVSVGHDLPAAEWSAAIERALASFPEHPYILQRFEKSRLVAAEFYDFEANALRQFQGRARLCPFYFVTGDTVKLGGVLATICPANKKILHGMSEAVLAPCRLPEPAAVV